jgi:hypothetical protein
MRILLKLATAVLLSSLAFPTPARADPVSVLEVGDGWTDFLFHGVGSPWDTAFRVSTLEPAVITVTDIFLSGDQFRVSITGTGVGTGLFSTSFPTSRGDFTDNREFAALDLRWSTGTFLVSAGDFVVSGTAIQSPFDVGEGSIRADLSPTPEPASLLLMGAGALSALLVRSRKNRSSGVGRDGARVESRRYA